MYIYLHECIKRMLIRDNMQIQQRVTLARFCQLFSTDYFTFIYIQTFNFHWCVSRKKYINEKNNCGRKEGNIKQKSLNRKKKRKKKRGQKKIKQNRNRFAFDLEACVVAYNGTVLYNQNL